jgi:hypothetical protein
VGTGETPKAPSCKGGARQLHIWTGPYVWWTDGELLRDTAVCGESKKQSYHNIREATHLTTLISWVGADPRRLSSIYLASDSRMTWPNSSTWDCGRKLFASDHQPDVFGYVGEAFFPSQTLGQIVDHIDSGLLLNRGTPPLQRAALIAETLERSAKEYPRVSGERFEILYATRHGHGSSSLFALFHLEFSGGRVAGPVSIELPKKSGVVKVLGSGGTTFERTLTVWQSGEVGGTSRSVFSALAEVLRTPGDPSSGGPPQLVGLYGVGNGKTFGVIWEGRRFCCGLEVGNTGRQRNVRWHNELFEICDPTALRRLAGAQPQPRPRSMI